MEVWLIQGLNGLQLSMLLFLLSVGLTIIFGLMDFVNLAHGTLYMLGAYIGVSVAAASGSFWYTLLFSPLAVLAIGVLLYLGIVRRMRHAGPLNQVLVTFGLMFVGIDLVRIIWGDIALGVEMPALLSGRAEFLGTGYPIYRFFVIGCGLVVMALLGLVLSRTSIGAMIRAGVENQEMAACLGIDVERLFFWVFCVGCALAGLAGAIAVPVFSATAEMATEILVPTLIVVVIGGLGSLRGAVLGSLVVGFLQTLGAVAFPALAGVLVYVLLAVALIWKPKGLLAPRG